MLADNILHPAPPLHVYRGRFAPSPTGRLHLGSLVTAVASYLDARQQQGTWLVRMEDLDPPREQAGAASAILNCLEAHGLTWDEEVIFQSQRHAHYHHVLEYLITEQLAYRCDCSRSLIQQDGGRHLGHCLRHPPAANKAAAIRLKTHSLPPAWAHLTSMCAFSDALQGPQQQNVAATVGDFVIYRKDGLFAYQLAVVADDIDQRITHVIRGCDLLDNTSRQLWLFELLNTQPPRYGHIPLIVNAEGQKLSKQTFAQPLNEIDASHNLWTALSLLAHTPPSDLLGAPPTRLLEWASSNWQCARLHGVRNLHEPLIANSNQP